MVLQDILEFLGDAHAAGTFELALHLWSAWPAGNLFQPQNLSLGVQQ